MEKYSVVLGVVSFLLNKPLQFNDTTFSVWPSLLKYNRVVEVLSKVVLHHY